MTVYEIVCDVNNFQSFAAVDEKIATEVMVNEQALLRFDGRSKEEGWTPPEVKILKPRLKRGDFFALVPGTFVASPEAWEKAAMFLEMAGEILPLPYQGHEYGILNITDCRDCLDEQKSTWAKMSFGKMLRKPYFAPNLFGESSIFKLPQHPGRIYCYEASRDPESEFKAFVEKEKLTGLSFREVWSGK